MPKRKQSPKSGARSERSPPVEAQHAPVPLTAHPPAKKSLFLAISIILFALWFLFLLVNALSA